MTKLGLKPHTILVLATLLLLPAIAAAEAYTVVLKNGTTFETRYRPVDAEFDDSVSMLLTDRGNWIALAKDDIADVTSAVEEGGFGVQIDTTTILLGWTYNEGLGDQGETTPEGFIVGPEGQLVAPAGGFPGAFQTAPPEEPTPFSIQQFVDAPVAGTPGAENAGGIPLSYTVY